MIPFESQILKYKRTRSAAAFAEILEGVDRFLISLCWIFKKRRASKSALEVSDLYQSAVYSLGIFLLRKEECFNEEEFYLFLKKRVYRDFYRIYRHFRKEYCFCHIEDMVFDKDKDIAGILSLRESMKSMILSGNLMEEDLRIIHHRFVDGMDQDEIGFIFERSYAFACRSLKNIVCKLKRGSGLYPF